MRILKADRQVLVTDASGNIEVDDRGLGLYDGDQRVVRRLSVALAGWRLTPLDTGAVRTSTASVALGASRTRGGGLVGRTPLLVTRETVLGAGLRESLSVTNLEAGPLAITARLHLDADFVDLFEVRGWRRQRHGAVAPAEVRGDRAWLRYTAVDGVGTEVAIRAPGASVGAERGRAGGWLVAEWRLVIPAGATREIAWEVAVQGPAVPEPEARARRRSDVASVITSDAGLTAALARGLEDLDALASSGPAPGQRYLAAGVPWFTGLFGRDSAIAGIASLPFRPQLAVDSLRVLAAHQATHDDAEHDAEPGKIPHEVHGGEMARLGETVFGRYFGSPDATPLWLMLLAATHAWTGDDALLDELWPAAMRANAWMDEAEARGGGFVRYQRRSADGLLNQGWKDDPTAVRFADGRLAEAPIALAEVQAYVYAAREGLARLALLRGDLELAERCRRRAVALRRRFDAQFWLPRAGTWAMAIDRDGRPADAIASNAGHVLWGGIGLASRSSSVAAVLTGPSLRSGWGLRTLGGDQVGYHPLGYHTGSVWPHDTAIAAAALYARGCVPQADLLAGELLDAAVALGGRLPELYAGLARGAESRPVPYPMACVPQAWAAAAPLMVLTAMLGLAADAPAGRLSVTRPRLPRGIDHLRILGLRVGGASVDLAWDRTASGVRVTGTVREGELQLVGARRTQVRTGRAEVAGGIPPNLS